MAEGLSKHQIEIITAKVLEIQERKRKKQKKKRLEIKKYKFTIEKLSYVKNIAIALFRLFKITK